jgi:hypothetical protein
MGTFIEFNPVGVVIIRHGTLNYLHSFHPTLYMTGLVTDESPRERQHGRMKEGRRMTDVGSMKTIGEGTECPGIGSSQMPIIRSLHNPT